MKKLLNIILFLLVAGWITGQPSHPTASGLSNTRFIDSPVSPLTGTHSYSIPMAAVSSGSLSLAVSLDYHSGGNRVGTIPGPAGLGWDLNVGGSIVRTVRGIRDEDNDGFWNDPAGNSDNPGGWEYRQVADGKKDGEPDLLTWRIPGKGGKFYLDRNHNIVTLHKTDVKIKMLSSTSGNNPFGLGFEIIDNDGTRYVFNNPSYQRENQDGTPYVIGWSMTRIISYDGEDQVDYYYDGKQSYNYSVLGMPVLVGDEDDDFDNTTPFTPNTIVTIIEQKLVRIEGEQDQIVFNYQKRTDLEECDVCPGMSFAIGGPITKDAYRLDKIEYENGNFCFEQVFDMSTFRNQYNSDSKHAIKLKLEGVQKVGCQGIEKENPYSFEYNGTFFSHGYQYFPNDIDRNIDHYGFYNKPANGNNGLGSNMIQNGTTAFGVAVGNTNRLPNSESAKVGLLKKLTLPTNGIIEFDYEGNDYEAYYENQSLFYVSKHCSEGIIASSPDIFITENIYNTGILNLFAEWENYSNIGGCINTVPRVATIKVFEGNSQIYTTNIYTWDYPAGTQSLAVHLDLINAINIGGTYRFVLEVSGVQADLRLTYNDSGPVTVGGSRVKEIRTWDGLDAATTNVQKYHYEKFSDPDESSGFVVALPQYKISLSTGHIVCQAYSMRALSNIDGLSNGYENVIVENVGLGKTLYTFKKEPFTEYQSYPPRPNEDLSGNMLNTTIKDLNGNVESTTDQSWARQNGYSGFFHLAQRIDGYTYANTYKIKTRRFDFVSLATSMTDGISSTVDYTYDEVSSPPIVGPIKIESTNSDGVETTKTIKYTSQYSLNNTVKNKLNEKNINLPYEQTVKVGSNTVDGTRTEYATFNSSGNVAGSGAIPRPRRIRRYERTWNSSGNIQSANWTERIYFDKYSHLGKLTRYRDKGYADTDLIYATSSSNVVAKEIENHTSAYTYFPGSNIVQEIGDVDGTTTSYTYDGLMRLKTSSEDCKGITTSYDYFYSPPGSNDKHKITTTTTFSGGSDANSSLSTMVSIEYIDNLGRTIQSVRKGQSPANKDIVTSTAFDVYGRAIKKYLPVEASGNTGDFLPIQSGWKFTSTVYEDSPLNRMKSETPPNWYATNYDNLANSGGDQVLNYQTGSSYAINSLSKTKVVDANGNRSYTFKDKKGRLVLSRKTNSSDGDRRDTYYLYDDKDRLTTVIPPGSDLSKTELNYYYRYDRSDKTIYKKIPSRGEVIFVFNDKELLAGQRDNNLLGQTQWLGYAYDDLGRNVKSGFVNGYYISDVDDPTFSEVLTEDIYGNSGIEKGKVIEHRSKVLGTPNFLTSSFEYDNCGRLITKTRNNHLNLNASDSHKDSYYYDKGDNLTKSVVRVNIPGEGHILSYISGYDKVGRSIYKKFGMKGQSDITLSQSEYNHREEIVTKYQGGTSPSGSTPFLQKFDFTYLANGLLKSINQPTTGSITPFTSCSKPNPTDYGNYTQKDLFYLELYYNIPIPGVNGVSRKNGDISGVRWQTKGRSFQNYNLTYDHLNQLKKAEYFDFDHGKGGLKKTDRYTATYSYDKRGNIEYLHRYGVVGTNCQNVGVIDNLVYKYSDNGSGNNLLDIRDYASSVTGFEGFKDATGDYTYDANGNITSDPHKTRPITNIQYNYLDLPESVSTNGRGGTMTLYFTYDAEGNLLRRKLFRGENEIETRDFIAGNEYLNGSIDAISHSEGRLKYNPRSGYFDQEYVFKDHLGNTRLVYSDKNRDGKIQVGTEILQESHFYPFGMEMNGAYIQNLTTDFRYKFNGIERLKDMNLELDFAFYRTMDPVIGRWWQVDPKTESAKHLSSYSAMHNSPVKYSDPNGDIIPAALVGAGIGLISNGIANVANGNDFFQGGLTAGILGAVGGGFSFGIGQAANIMIGAGVSQLGVAAFQAGAHGALGGFMSAAQGGKFGSGFLSGSLSSGMSSGATALGASNMAMIGIGGLSGGVGSAIAGGSFWRGVGQGVITSGLNHAAHSGLMGQNMAASLITGRLRHMFGPDAISGSGSLNVTAGVNVGTEAGGLLVLRGNEAGLHPIVDVSSGVGVVDVSLTVEATSLYYSGRTSNIKATTFYGNRWEGNFAVDVFGASVGANASFARSNGGFVIGVGPSLGIGASPTIFSGNVNWGASGPNGTEARKYIVEQLGID